MKTSVAIKNYKSENKIVRDKLTWGHYKLNLYQQKIETSQ